MSRAVVRHAGEAFPFPVRSLDAIHLASALLIRDREAPDLVFATHDRRQGKAALAQGFEVLGL